ncbi:hypothetical protein BTM25_47700 [Actinomadura rubteroloni]|uniref:Uncharacterized protein n=1 Tax=Actinomadura rubteroloni TaxID=1926885 RepID=A0A2P4UF00_9ACTN|nr:hypothetical protein BTM25_47700 [Actinomadura rubteroloni]
MTLCHCDWWGKGSLPERAMDNSRIVTTLLRNGCVSRPGPKGATP